MASMIRSDLEFVLQQILISEAHAAGADLTSLVPNTFASLGLRTVDGSYNNLMPGQSQFGAADNPFPQLVDPVFRNDADGDTFGPVTNNDYGVAGNVADADPRIISNLVADMTTNNPAAVSAFVNAGLGTLDEFGVLRDLAGNVIPQGTLLTIPNVAPDEGLSAPFNSWFTFFGQFFDHGLDLVNKGGNESVFIPLDPDDPLFNPATPGTNFMVLTRATPNPDGSHTNQTTSFVDQNQTYTSHASHQVFLREYELNGAGRPVATGKLIDGADGGLANWADVKAQALMLGIALTDLDALNVPLLRTDAYGRFIPAANGFAQLITDAGGDGVLNTDDDTVVVGTAVGVSPLAVGALRTGHAFLNDIAHNANPVDSQTGVALAADGDEIINVGPMPAGTYDDDLLDAHFITGDGRGNENIALSAVHHVFHSEHNRQVDEIKATVLATGDAAFIASWQLSPGVWNGERIFQAARFATEMQYQHLVFEEFARKMQPAIDGFLPETNYDTTIDPAIVAEFAHAVFRVGHSMLTETVDRLDPNFVPDDIALVQAFLNPLEFTASGPTPEAAAGAIVRGMTRQQGNAIDEFVTDALRNNLLGLPLDLAALNIARGRDTGTPTLNAARRDFYATTADPQLKPYTSWTDLTQNLKHEASVINFIAAYGTHAELLAADVDTLAEKRAVAAALVFGGAVTLNAGAADERVFTADDTDRLAFLNSTGVYASGANGVTITGVDAIDLWIGGLAEKIMPFGGMLGSTFNFVFETQMEALQNGDRFYYLARLAGLNFLTEMENNTFAKLVMANTDATHLPADIFSTPGLILEVNQANQFNAGVGADPHADPVGDNALLPLVVRDDPTTPAVESNFLKYTGDEHVVLGGTAGNDTLIASIGDDTIYGDGGNDRIEGGDGNDQVDGGAGDDIITDRGGDDVLKGDSGNDVMHGGQGFNLLIAGSGNDFVVTGEDVSEVFAGPGDDFVLGSKGNLPTLGNEGNDWIELGTQDGTSGDSFDPLFQDGIVGNDVLISAGGFDELIGEGGDDIFSGSDGEDRFEGGSGFDWATYKFDPYGVSADMLVSAFVTPPVAPSNAGMMDRFEGTEGLSGSAFSDVLRGDNNGITQILQSGATGSVLTNLGLINGLAAILPQGTTSFGAGNIILGGSGSDVIEGRGGNDIIDGDAWLNVRVAVTGHVPRIAGATPITSVDSIKDLVPYMLSGEINPSQLSIVREILVSESTDFDTAMFSGLRDDYTIVSSTDAVTGITTTTVTDNVGGRDFSDGTDTLHGIERLQFSDVAVVRVPGINSEPVGSLTIDSTTPQVGQVLTASSLGITDADNAGGTLGDRPVSYFWQWESDPGSGRFRDIVDAGGLTALANSPSFTVTTAQEGFAMRVRAVYQDDNGVLENVFSAATAPVAGVVAPPPADPIPVATLVDSPGVRFIRDDLQFILDQIVISERHAAGEELRDILPNARVSFGLRTVDGSFNNLVQDQSEFGAADTLFPRLVDPLFRDADAGTSYAQTSGSVTDAEPRIISNLIVDQTAANPATAGLGELVTSPGQDGVFGTTDDRQVYLIPNTAPDEGLSAPFNAFFTFFGQFFDHGLDLVSKGGNGVILVPLKPDDPLIGGADGVVGDDPDTLIDESADDLPASQQFLALTRATQFAGPGADGVLGTADDTVHEAENKTTPFVDQNQTYTSHPSHQVFVREYAFNAAGHPVSTGKLITSRDLGDGEFGNGNDTDLGGMATWALVKAQARDMLGIQLTDADVVNLPWLRTDAYGKFIPGANGFAQLITDVGADGVANTVDDVAIEGDPSANGGLGISTAAALRTGHAFLDDIAHAASPFSSQTGAPLAPDADGDTGNTQVAGFYDNELLDAHYIAGDGRVNENIALTGIHHVFHAEHNRLVEHTKEVILASNDPAFIAQWQLADGSWNGERLFQAARFGTEMQYQHLVFEEFARKVQPQIDIFFAATQVYDTEIDPSIVAEFAHTVYRFGHSMLTETVDRFDSQFAVVGDSNPTEAGNQQLGLIAAFLNPLEFAASGVDADAAAGALARGLTRQQGNEIDEFVTEALRNNLLGLPLDLATMNILRGRDTGVPTLNAARRNFHDVTGDSQLKPYASWVEFMEHIKHPASVVNFIAAYGTHNTITEAIGVEAKRDAAMELVFGVDQNGDLSAPFDRLAFLNSTGQYASGPNGVTTTGVDDIDLWIGGLAEKQMPFGGLLGSTFNFVFEEQLEKLQDGDRFYYLERTQGLNFLTELENNTFARLVMANTDATHLPGDVFTAPGFTLEVDQSLQFTGLDGGLGLEGRGDPEGVSRDDPGTVGVDPNYLKYSGDEHVVLGGTAGDDTIISSLGDDTLWGDAGSDHLEGGDGNDFIFGGGGDDFMTDSGGDDNMQGGDGNDAIHGGNGANLVLGGFGNDFIVTGEDPSEAFGGPGNDFILGARGNEFVFGNEGDDWIQFGMADGSAGENFDAFSRDIAVGNDVFIGNTISDRMDGEGGDDIMFGNGGQVDRYEGFSGFDWAGFKDAPYGVTADLLLRAFDETPVPLSNATVLARFTSIEGMSGSMHADILSGDDNDATAMALSGVTGSVLRNIGLIDGLQELLDGALGGPVTSFAGNIILGGSGSDLLEGRGGNDLIDGDRSLNVRISVRTNVDDPLTEIASYDSMTNLELQAAIFNGTWNPGQLAIVREIVDFGTNDFDTAVFSDVFANYQFLTNDAGQLVVSHNADPLLVGPGGFDGDDTLVNIERLQFSDTAAILDGDGIDNAPPEGQLRINDTTPIENQLLTALVGDIPATPGNEALRDPDNISATNPQGLVNGPISFYWQAEVAPGIFEDILDQNAGGEVARANGSTFRPGVLQLGQALRVRAVYKDDHDVLENVYSAATAPVGNVNSPAQGQVLISDVTPTETQEVQASFVITDEDGVPTDPADFSYQWQQSAPGGGAVFTNIVGANAAAFTPGQAQVNTQLRVVVSFVDDAGGAESVTSAATVVVGDFVAENDAAQVLNGTNGQDIINGGAGNDTINGLAEDDVLDGGADDDIINGGTGDDLLFGGTGADAMNGGAGIDTITGGAGDDTAVGGDDDDRFVATLGDGNDNYQGQRGVDTYDLSALATGVTINFTAATGPDTGTDSLQSIENIIGSQGNDSITLSGVSNRIDGQAGDDFISVGGAVDFVAGGLGNDTISGGSGNDTLNGNEGDDTFNYTIGDGADIIDGGDGSNDRLNILGTAAANTLAVVVSGTAITAFAGSTFVGIESITADLLGGPDTLTYGASNSVLAVDLSAGSATGFTSVANIENVTGGNAGDTLIGSVAANTLTGGAGNDTITGGAGNDTLNGGVGLDTFIATLGDGNDAYIGGASLNDTYDLSGTAAAATVNLLAGTASSAQTGNDTVSSVEHIIGSSSGDTLTGSNGFNTLDGGDGNDSINAGFGNDIVNGGAGDDILNGDGGSDVMSGGLGNDTVSGGDGNDRFIVTLVGGNDSYDGGIGIDTYDLSATSSGTTVTTTTATGGESGDDTLAAIENVIGSQGNDIIVLNAGTNRVDGQAGNDVINTGASNDRLIGGLGADTMDGGTGNDIFEFAPGFGLDTINGFDASPSATNTQDLLDITGFGINAGNFAASVTITDLGNDTQVDFAGDLGSILLVGVNGLGANVITQGDFILSP